MKIVKVTYTTKSEFAEQNQTNIKKVMTDLQKLQYSGINYIVCIALDGKTFIHTAFFKSDEDQKLLNVLPLFKSFQDQLKASEPESLPKQELLMFVSSTPKIFVI